MRIFTPSEIRKINKTALAEEIGCGQAYVSMVLHGTRRDETDLSKLIVKKAKAVIDAFKTAENV